MICPNCSYDTHFLGKKRRLTLRGLRGYCPNCGQYLDKSVQTLIGGELHGSPLQIDETTNELILKRKSLFRQPQISKRISLSNIEAIKYYRVKEIVGGGTTTSSADFYLCDLLISNWQWQTLIKESSRQNVLRIAAAIGRRLEKPKEKISELANHLYGLFHVSTPYGELRFGLQEPLKIEYIGYDLDKNKFEVEGMIPFQDPDVEGVVVLHCDSLEHYYHLGYLLPSKTIQSVWTHRKRKLPGFGHLVNVEWRGGPLCSNLNADETLKALLVSHLEESDCDVVISNDQLNGSLLIVFGDACCRQWVRLPKPLFPSEKRVELIKAIAKRVREFQS